MLSEMNELYQINIVQKKFVEVIRSRVILDDGVEVARQNHQAAFCPGDDVSAQDAMVQDVCKLLWTDEVVKAYKDEVNATMAAIEAKFAKP